MRSDTEESNNYSPNSKIRYTNTSNSSLRTYSYFQSHPYDKYALGPERFDKYTTEPLQGGSTKATSLTSDMKSTVSNTLSSSLCSRNRPSAIGTSSQQKSSNCQSFTNGTSPKTNFSDVETAELSTPLPLYRRDLLSTDNHENGNRSRYRDYSVSATNETSSPFSGLHTKNTDESPCSLSTFSTLNHNDAHWRPLEERNETNISSVFQFQPVSSSMKENIIPGWKFLDKAASSDSADTFDTVDYDGETGDDDANFSLETQDVNEKSGFISAFSGLSNMVKGKVMCRY